VSAHSVIFTTTDDGDQAERIARGLVERRLAACVQISRVASHYVWDGETTQSAEYLLAIKTSAARYDDVAAFVMAEHHYEVPELIEVPVSRGSPGYLGWIDSMTGAQGQ
jgi:periplasmic divalent cation tolerance protein